MKSVLEGVLSSDFICLLFNALQWQAGGIRVDKPIRSGIVRALFAHQLQNHAQIGANPNVFRTGGGEDGPAPFGAVVDLHLGPGR